MRMTSQQVQHPDRPNLLQYNGTQIPQHKYSYVDRKTESDAIFYVADVTGPTICGLPTSCQLHLLELHCEIHVGSDKKSFPEIKSKGDLQVLYPGRFEGIGKFEGGIPHCH